MFSGSNQHLNNKNNNVPWFNTDLELNYRNYFEFFHIHHLHTPESRYLKFMDQLKLLRSGFNSSSEIHENRTLCTKVSACDKKKINNNNTAIKVIWRRKKLKCSGKKINFKNMNIIKKRLFVHCCFIIVSYLRYYVHIN